MTIHAALRHVTRYRYDRKIGVGPQVVRLRPAAHCRTPVLSYALTVSPKEHFLNWQQDAYGNFLARIVVPEPTDELCIEVDLVAEMLAINPFDFFIASSGEFHPFEYEPGVRADLAPYLVSNVESPLLDAWLAALPHERILSIDLLTDVNRRLSEQVDYVIRMEPGVQSPEQTLASGRGSCRDSGWLLVHILRRLGIAARFVSGYLIQLKPDVPSLDGPSGAEADFCDLHAWAEAYLPGAGWIGLDATSGLLAGGGHLPIACTPEPSRAAPISGTLEKCEVEFEFDMTVTRIAETPRVTLPYSDAQWDAIVASGHEVDDRLRAGDVRLTMGGEPTFVSVDDMESPEWNTEAVGPHKVELATQLAKRLRSRLAPEGVLHFGQGKWYPGEPLPRWAYALLWREDGEPLWRQAELIATEPSDKANLETAEVFVKTLARKLGADPEHALPAYESPWHSLSTERSLPPGIDPTDAALDEPEARSRLAAAFERGLTAPVGYVLPVQPWQSRDRRGWRSERWALRTDALLLVPGDSPIGLRLPIGSLAPVPAAHRVEVVAEVPFERAPPLPPRNQLRVTRRAAGDASDEAWAGAASIRTALAVEPREGFVYVFLPPVAKAADYADLLASVEDTAAELKLPIRLEGYEPPPDHRITSMRITPDPGVIEVNVAPAASWDELVTETEALYEDARQCRLAAEKFMVDGRHTGTGGGNHVVLGGATPADSPFLRRPDLLKSVVGYFVNHPSLSFLFSGMFIGPTSQAPRVDQARDDALYELEIALSQIPGRDDTTASQRPWLIDRILRDVLVDVTGNTHRTEICIDKLYSPDSATGRLGLVEFRSFEMPPHARMSLVQGLLLRALVATFWETPYEQPLQRWGTALHDRFMLPHFVWQDLLDVLDDVRRAGIAVDDGWFAPHFEFRFPKLGAIAYRGIGLEIRSALEPWHVTGEEGVSGGTARYVDSSIERVQVRADGLDDSRYCIAVNGRRVPLRATGVNGQFVAGVRYRAWQPPHCLHPTIGTHVPLTFDLVDQWSGRSVAGCRYDVGHPGGRSHDTFPVNALEAEGRRLARFTALSHTGGPLDPPLERPNWAFPLTLDLRTPS